MAKEVKQEPQSATDYDERTTAAVKSVLIELGQILGSYKGKFAVIGGAVPWLLLKNAEMTHVGTLDVDIALDAEALKDGDEYKTLIESLMGSGYHQRKELKKFQLVRQVDAKDGSPPIDVIVDFLMPKDAKLEKNKPVLIENFAVQRADGAELALHFHEMVAIDGSMPAGGKNRVEIAIASIPALLAMKGYAIEGRHKQKDAYDIYYCVRNYPGGPSALAADCKPILQLPSGKHGYDHIVRKFAKDDGYGPTCVRKFVEESDRLEGRTPAQWQTDAFGQVQAWLKALGLVRATSPDRYNAAEAEAKWQKIWDERGIFATRNEDVRNKYYVLEMFPYPSGRIHMGHVRNYTMGDVVARVKRAMGFDVLHPMGWDAFGMPAENAAIERKVHPKTWTYQNIDAMRKQLKSMGLSLDWSREIATCDPAYYKHQQKMFLDFLRAGLVERKHSEGELGSAWTTPYWPTSEVIDGRG